MAKGKRWQLQEAKNKFSQVVEQARRRGPQIITLRGKEAVVVLAVEEYRRLTTPPTGLTEFFRHSPLADAELDLSRSQEPARDVEL